MKTLAVFPTKYEAAKIFAAFGKKKVLADGVEIAAVDWLGGKNGFEAKLSFGGGGESRADSFVFLISGMACEAAAKAVVGAARDFCVDSIILAGFGGACDPSLRLGDFVCDSADLRVLRAAESVSARDGLIASAGSPAGKMQKAALFKDKGALAVDMEADMFRASLRSAGVSASFSHLRCISDLADADVPLENLGISANASTGALSFNLLKFFCGILRRPSLAASLVKFVACAWKAQKIYNSKIADFFFAYIDILRKPQI